MSTEERRAAIEEDKEARKLAGIYRTLDPEQKAYIAGLLEGMTFKRRKEEK